MKSSFLLTSACVALAMTFASCANFTGANTYNANELGGAQATYIGTVSNVETVKIQANTANVGTGMGAVAGGLTGAILGGGTARLATAAGGTIIGGLLGNQIDKGVNTQTGERITVRLDQKVNGSRDYTIIQAVSKNNPIQVGQRVRVLIGNNGSRVLAY